MPLFFTKSYTSESIAKFRQSTSGLQSRGEPGDRLELCSFVSAVPGSSSGAKENFDTSIITTLRATRVIFPQERGVQWGPEA